MTDEILAKYPANANKDINLGYHGDTPFQYQKCILLQIDSVDYRNFKTPEQNTFINICGYAMQKYLSTFE